MPSRGDKQVTAACECDRAIAVLRLSKVLFLCRESTKAKESHPDTRSGGPFGFTLDNCNPIGSQTRFQ